MALVSPITTLEQFAANLRALNRALAQYKLLLRQVGTNIDGPKVRRQLQTLRSRLVSSIRDTKDTIVPTMLSHSNKSPEDATWREWEARYATFMQILESTIDNMEKSLTLLTRLPCDSEGRSRQIFTGISDVFNIERRSILSLGGSVLSSRRGSISSQSTAGKVSNNSGCPASPEPRTPSVEDEDLQQEVTDIQEDLVSSRQLMEELQSAVIVTHWNVEHSFDLDSLLALDDDFDEAASDAEDGGDPASLKTRQGAGPSGGSASSSQSREKTGSGLLLCIICK